MNVEIICNRCAETVRGIVIEATDDSPTITGGFYDVSENSCWHKYARGAEVEICDKCMWDDPAFLRDYPGTNRKIPNL